MNTLTLQKLVLENIKGVEALTVEPKGKDISICGANKLGKSTTGDSLTWLLFGKDMQGRGDKKANIKTLDNTGKEVGHIDHAVEGTFLYNGDEVVLKKILKEKHTKKRGDAKKSFTGNVTEYHIDGLKTTAGKFSAAVAEITDEQTFRLLTVPFFFAEGLKWEERRKKLLEICGDVSDEDIIAGSDKLSELPGILNGKNAETEYLPHLKEQRRKVNEQLDDIPIRIDENSKSLPDLSGIDQKEDSQALVNLNKDIAEKERTLNGLDTGGASIELKQDLISVDQKISKHENDVKDLQAEYVRAKKDELAELKHKDINAGLDADANTTTISGFEKELSQLKLDLDGVSKEYDEILAEKFEPVDHKVCEYCDVETPADKQSAAFNVVKASKLDALNIKGQKLTEDIAATNGQIESVKGKDAIVDYTQAISKCAAELLALENPESPVDITEEHHTDLEEKARIEADIAKADAGEDTGLADKIQKEIDTLTEKRGVVTERIEKCEAHKKVGVRNDELRAEETKLSAEFDRIESELFLIEEFIKVKVYSLGVKVAAKFGDIQFKLFDQAINGGVMPCCEVLVAGVPFGSVNNADRINTGLKIINVLSEHHDVTLPVVVDNCEAVNKLESAGSQMIKLVVTKDKELTFKQ